MIADHFEPLWNGADEQTAARRVALWTRAWPGIAGQYADSAGRPPRYTFFYPEEEYRPHLLGSLARLVDSGIADIEVHLHHDGEGEQNFVDRISSFTNVLRRRHGLLHDWNGRPGFAFIHGNWALDNSRPDGRYCGLNNELSVLLKLGCYADFTEPSAPNCTQVRMLNSIYWAEDDPTRPKSHDTRQLLKAGATEPAEKLLMIPGPLGIRVGGDRLRPRLDTGELAGYDLPTRARVRLWLDVAPRIEGDVFIKLFAHGTQERNAGPLLEGGLQKLLTLMLEETRRRGLDLYFASAWEVRLAIGAISRLEDPVAGIKASAGTGRR
jgi:hypothetical protein